MFSTFCPILYLHLKTYLVFTKTFISAILKVLFFGDYTRLASRLIKLDCVDSDEEETLPHYDRFEMQFHQIYIFFSIGIINLTFYRNSNNVSMGKKSTDFSLTIFVPTLVTVQYATYKYYSTYR